MRQRRADSLMPKRRTVGRLAGGQSESRKWAEDSRQERLTGRQDGRQEALRAHPCPHKG